MDKWCRQLYDLRDSRPLQHPISGYLYARHEMIAVDGRTEIGIFIKMCRLLEEEKAKNGRLSEKLHIQKQRNKNLRNKMKRSLRMIRYDVMERIEVGDMQIISANPVKDKVVIKVRCPICGKQTILDMTYTQWRRYTDGKELVQQIFPEKSASDRELLISGICSKCWDDMFS